MVIYCAMPRVAFLMRKVGLKFTLLLTMIFVGQSVFASFVPCMFMDTSSDMTMDSAHEGHTMESGFSSTTENNCCGDGYCSVSGCIAPAGIADTAVFHADSAAPQLWLFAIVSSPSHFATPVFHPPILS